MESMKSAFGTQIDFLKKEHNKVLVQLSNSIENPPPPPANVIVQSPIVSLPQLHTLAATTSTPPVHINPTFIQGPSRDKLEDPVAAFEAAMVKLDREKSKKREAEALILDIEKKEAAIEKLVYMKEQREAEKAMVTLGKGLLSRSKRENLVAAGNEQLEKEQAEREREIDGKNPWGSIAENWGSDGREEKVSKKKGRGKHRFEFFECCGGLGGHRYTCGGNRSEIPSCAESSVIALTNDKDDCLSFDLVSDGDTR